MWRQSLAAAREDTEDSKSEEDGGDGLADVADLPTADFVRFNAAGLQAALAEGCLYGWSLWGAEAGARDQIAACGEIAARALLVPQEAVGRDA